MGFARWNRRAWQPSKAPRCLRAPGGLLLDTVVDSTIADTPVTQANLDSGVLGRAIAGLSTVADRDAAEKRLEKVEKRRGDLFLDLVGRYESDRCKGESAWAAVNAVSEMADHSELVRYKGTTTERRENRFMSILDGRSQVITDRAVELAVNA